MRLRRLLALLAGAVCSFVLLCGCTGYAKVPREWESKAGVQVLRLRWTKTLAPAVPNFQVPQMQEEHDRFYPIETGAAGFDADARRAFVGSSLGSLYCLDLASGRSVWRYDVDDAVGSVPLYDSVRKAVYFGADDGRFYALQARSGRLLWSLDVGSEIRRAAVQREDTLYVASADDTVLALDAKTGQIIWQYRRPPTAGFASMGYAGLVLSGDSLFTGFSDGTVMAIDAVAGGPLWEADLAQDVPITTANSGIVSLTDADATPVLVGGFLVAASVAGGVRGLDPASGKVVWSRPDVVGATGLAADIGTVYAALAGKGLVALDGSNGQTLWTQAATTGVLQDPVVFRDVVIVSDSEFGLAVFSNAGGRLLQRLDPKTGIFARPAVLGSYALVLGNRGTLFGMSIR
ncbi:MAG: PQQ-binding-like beta-propeller repeat protein [Myxococcota bacterium]|nr:PQQ-binding-like beta-propeller repeat protein [Myxococcota bacterium]